MKGDMESQRLVGSEQLTAILDEVNKLDEEISRLTQFKAVLEENNTLATDKIGEMCKDYKFVYWLQASTLPFWQRHKSQSLLMQSRSPTPAIKTRRLMLLISLVLFLLSLSIFFRITYFYKLSSTCPSMLVKPIVSSLWSSVH